MSGFYLMRRGWLDDDMFQSPKREPFCHRAAWAWLIERAAYQDGLVRHNGKERQIQRGQIFSSLQDMGAAWGWNATKVARFLTALQRAGAIVTVSVKAGSIISICEYGDIQSPGEATVTSRKSDRDTRWEATVTGTKQEKESNTSEAKASSVPAERARDLAGSMVEVWRTECGDILKIPLKLDSKRISACSARWRDSFGRDIEQWRAYCQAIRASPFLCGDSDRGWKANFDWALTPKAIRGVQEGKYERAQNRPARAGDLFDQRRQREAANLQAGFDAIARATGLAGGVETPRNDPGGDRSDPTIIDLVPRGLDARDAAGDRGGSWVGDRTARHAG